MPDVQYLDIPLAQLHDSPTQPRLVYDDAYLQELGADIKSHGRNLSPLLVRPRVPELFAAVGDPDLAREATAGYEIVFGHCRKRGIEIAGLETARCEVRTMTDEEVERAQISENLQRKNVHPFEEAQGFQALIERHKDTADAIAARTGKSRSYVYGRLKLLQACPTVRKACIAGEIDAEVALLIARLRTFHLQEKALARINAKHWDMEDGGQKSYRNIRDLLQEEFTLSLKGALFSVTDAALLSSAGACTTCPKRSANAPEFEDLLKPRRSHFGTKAADANLCTDPDCFAAKKAAHLRNEATALRKGGREVIEGNRARALVGADGKVKGGYLPLSQVKEELQRARFAAQGSRGKIPMPAAVLIQDPRTGKTFEAVKESELVVAGTRAAGTQARDSAAAARGGYSSAGEMLDRQRRQEQADHQTARNRRWLQAVREAAQAQPRSEFDMRLICRAMLERADDYDESGLDMLLSLREVTLSQLRGQIDLLPASELALLMLDIVLAEGCEVDSWNVDTEPGPLTVAASHYGLDLAALEQPAEPISTPSLAARANNDAEAKPDAVNATKPAARYRNQATGETWNGRGLMPLWLKTATAGGAKLSDFERGSSQAASGGKVNEAGSAGKASSTTPADAGETGLQGEEQGAEA